jgi:hypothetical protein
MSRLDFGREVLQADHSLPVLVRQGPGEPTLGCFVSRVWGQAMLADLRFVLTLLAY